MDIVNKSVRRHLIASIVSTLLFVAGIPMIIFGAVYDLMYVMIPGIVFTAVDFYAMPLLWISFGTAKERKRVVSAVVNEHIYTVTRLAMQLSQNPAAMKNTVSKCFEKGYLTGYLFDGENITANFNKAQTEEIVTEECVGCGAHYNHPKSEVGRCPYCGRIAEKK